MNLVFNVLQPVYIKVKALERLYELNPLIKAKVLSRVVTLTVLSFYSFFFRILGYLYFFGFVSSGSLVL